LPALTVPAWPKRRRTCPAGQTPDGTAPAREGAIQRGHGPLAGTPGAIGRGWLVAGLAACAGYAGCVALLSSSVVERPWGLIAAPCYAAAAVMAALWRRRGTDAALVLSLAGGLLAPLAWLAVRGVQQREVNVIAWGAHLLIHHGTPYRSVAALAHTPNPDAYNPYLPAMEVFALGRAVWRHAPLTDPRIWFAVVFAVVFWLALRATGTRQSARWTALVAATPVFAFPLAVSGDDVPVIGLMCLGLALLGPPAGTRAGDQAGAPPPPQPQPASRPWWAGLALGVAAAMKATAWPALLIAAVLVAARDGRRAAARLVAAALGVFVVLVGPVAAVSPSALTDNTIAFPLGLASVKSGAVSPLPGVLLSQTGHTGHLIATGLLALAGLAVVVSLVARPPRTVPSATWRLIVALVLMFTLAPSTRFGYYIYPLGLGIWLWISHRPPADEGRIPLCG
jgi:Glycosyltransferase family 87